MFLDLSQIRQPETRVDRTYDAALFAGRTTEFQVVESVALGLGVHKDKDRFRLVGRMSTVLEVPCSRCLEPYRLPIDVAVDVRYLPHALNTGDEREVEEDDLTDAFYRDETIDLGQLMDEQFYLALPMKPLCQEGCKGLCARCGVNRNVEMCQCEEQWEDPRLAGLKALMNRDKDHA
ncbi:MAG: YceD family protein [Acidobacteriota bacterium]